MEKRTWRTVLAEHLPDVSVVLVRLLLALAAAALGTAADEALLDGRAGELLVHGKSVS